MKPALLALLALTLSLLLGCSASPNDASPGAAPAPELSAIAALGDQIFHDESLSASGHMACATCHSPTDGFAAAQGGGPVPLGGPALATPGFRNAPSLKYLAANPSFFFDGEGTPTGGFDRDGRANSLALQARRPFL